MGYSERSIVIGVYGGRYNISVKEQEGVMRWEIVGNWVIFRVFRVREPYIGEVLLGSFLAGVIKKVQKKGIM